MSVHLAEAPESSAATISARPNPTPQASFHSGGDGWCRVGRNISDKVRYILPLTPSSRSLRDQGVLLQSLPMPALARWKCLQGLKRVSCLHLPALQLKRYAILSQRLLDPLLICCELPEHAELFDGINIGQAVIETCRTRRVRGLDPS